jgi:uncharacterized membrane protein (DUF373 family)
MWKGVTEAETALASLDSAATRLFRKVVDFIVKLLIPVTVVALMMGVARVFLDLWEVWKSPSISRGFDLLVGDILSTFVVIELLKSVVEYLEAHRLRLVFIVDAAVVFLLREVMIGVYQHKLGAGQIAAIAALLAVLGAFRLAAARFSLEVADAPARP